MPSYDLERIRRCARRFLAENPEDPTYRFGGAGTLFLVKTDSQLVCVTARHVLRGINRGRIRILAGGTMANALTPRGWWTQNSNDACYRDLSIGDIRPPDVASLVEDALPLDRSSVDVGRESFAHDSPLLIIGFPSELQEVDFDNRVITNHCVVLGGRYVGPRDSERSWVHVMRVDAQDRGVGSDGLSGSPVFGRGRTGSWGLAGIAIQGVDRLHFIDSLVLWEAMRRIADGRWIVEAG